MFAKEKLMSEAVVKVRKILRLTTGSNARTSCMLKVFSLFYKSSTIHIASFNKMDSHPHIATCFRTSQLAACHRTLQVMP